MSANETTKFQVNFKLPDGTLINLYADTPHMMEELLTSAQDFALLINTTSQALAGAGALASIAQPMARPVAQAQVSTSSSGNDCKHGPMVHRSGEKGGKRWQGYFCPADRNAPDKCDPVFVR